MLFLRSTFSAILLALAACSPAGPPVTATDVLIVAPLPGRAPSAAYLTLHNESDEAIRIRKVSSPEFEVVEMHQSIVGDAAVRMRRLETLTIDPGASATFESGGRHLMLIDPVDRLLPGMLVSLHFEYGDDGLLIVTAPLRPGR